MKKSKNILLMILIVAFALLLWSCDKNNRTPINVCIDGDIENGVAFVDLNAFNTQNVPLKSILKKVMPLSDDFDVLITPVFGNSTLLTARELDGTSISTTADGKYRIDNISEITVVSKIDTKKGVKILTMDSTLEMGRGTAKMKLYSQIDDTNEYKQIATKTNEFLVADKIVAYFKDYDMQKNVDDKLLSWKQGSLILDEKPVYGFASGTDVTLMDFYEKMKDCVDNNKKVMFILPDGFSLEQSKAFGDDLSVLSFDKASGVSLSVNRAISPVALATIVTGKSPYQTGVHFDENQMRSILKPNATDIFEYATSQGKSVAYLEGSGNLIIASVGATYGLTDRITYENAVKAINQGKDLIFVHFHEIDDENHRNGPLSESAKTKCVEIDYYINSLIAQFNGTIIIVSDHGHNTVYDSRNNPQGKHGSFTNLDMYIPYFIYEK